MKKRLEADLISIAHRVLKLKNKSEVDQLYLETRKLYEALTVLKFYGDNYEQVKTEISEDDLTEKLLVKLETKEDLTKAPTEEKVEKKAKKVIEEPAEAEKIKPEIETPKDDVIAAELNLAEQVEATESIIEEEKKEEIIVQETVLDEIPNEEIIVQEKEIEAILKLEVDSKIEPLNELLEMLSSSKDDKALITEPLKPEFELTFDSKINEKAEDVKVENQKQVVFDDFLGTNYAEPVFIKPEELEAEKKAKENSSKLSEFVAKSSLNDKISKGLTIGLNDRVAFMKHLFDDNSEDYNRVLSQLITFDSLQEARDFLDNFVKPDYNDWNGKEEYADRFIEIIEKKFS